MSALGPQSLRQWCSIRQTSRKKIATPVRAAKIITNFMTQFCSRFLMRGSSRSQRKGSDGGAFEDAAKGQAEHSISGMAVSLVAHERMYEADNRKARPRRSIANRSPATIGVPAEDLAGKPY